MQKTFAGVAFFLSSTSGKRYRPEAHSASFPGFFFNVLMVDY